MAKLREFLDPESIQTVRETKQVAPDNAGTYGKGKIICPNCGLVSYTDGSPFCRPCERETYLALGWHP